MKTHVLFAYLLAAASVVAGDTISSYTYRGTTVTEARVVGGSPETGVLLRGKNGKAVTVPWTVAEKDFALRDKLPSVAPKAAHDLVQFRMIKKTADGLICQLFEWKWEEPAPVDQGLVGVNYRRAPRRVARNTYQDVLVVGYKNADKIAEEEIFAIPAERGDVRDVGGRSLRVYTAKE